MLLSLQVALLRTQSLLKRGHADASSETHLRRFLLILVVKLSRDARD